MRLHDRPLGFCVVCLAKSRWEPAVAIHKGTGYCKRCLLERPTRDTRPWVPETETEE
jgi:hypothetical protein